MYKNLNESTVQTRVEKAHKIATKAKLNLMKYCLLNRKEDDFCRVTFDRKVQLYIQQAGQRGGVISRIIAVSVAKVLLRRDESLGKVTRTEAWPKSMLKRNESVRRTKTSPTVKISEVARKENEYRISRILRIPDPKNFI